MTNERLTIQEIEQKYPDAWLLIVDCEISENTELLSGVVAVHSKSREDIHDALIDYKGQVAIHSTREIPEDVEYIL
ncbi:MAG: hypothetical protein OXL96_00660 [Candidatus Poribacteria bacterium]|nr:hypothetical protein [Candidatus Poribacteria bacterium]